MTHGFHFSNRIYVEEQDKFVLVYALFKLKLVRGKSIIFVNSVDKCYRIKLYLEQFGIPGLVTIIFF